MKALFEKISPTEESSFITRLIRLPYFDAPLHYHPEYELTLITKGSGRRLVGDSVENFEAGDLVLLGSNLSHFWRSDRSLVITEELSEAIVIQFSVDFVQHILKRLPECKAIISLLNLSKSGIKFSSQFRPLLENIVETHGVTRLLLFIELLAQLSQTNDHQLLASKNYNIKPDEAENERMRRVLEYTLENFKGEISLEIIAEVANLTVPSFCRYFKSRTRKTYMDYLNEIRVSYARKLLMETELVITQIGFECGFQNPSHFYRIFKNQTGNTPLGYRKTFN